MFNVETGIGCSIGHHGELLQGVFHDGKKNRRALITLPCANYFSLVTISRRDESGVEIRPISKKKTRSALNVLLRKLQIACDPGFLVTVYSNIPEGKGLGSSTADITATLKALGSLLRLPLNDELIAVTAVEAESASDPLIFGFHPVLFAQREGHTLVRLADEFPAFQVLSVDLQPSCTFDTLTNAPCDYDRDELRTFQSLREMVEDGFFRKDIRQIANVATSSASINQRYYPKPHFKDLHDIVKDCGALGLQTAHSGTVSGLLFDPSLSDHNERMQQAECSLAEHGIKATGKFNVPNSHLELSERVMDFLLKQTLTDHASKEMLGVNGKDRGPLVLDYVVGQEAFI